METTRKHVTSHFSLLLYIILILMIGTVRAATPTPTSAPTVNVTLSWTDTDTNITLYTIYYNTGNSALSATSKTTSIVLSLVPGQPYQASVTATNAIGLTSAPSAVLSFTSPTPVSVPTNLKEIPTVSPASF